MTNGPLIAIVGQTATGKSDLALELADYLQRHRGLGCEIICADSRTVYQGMDIGTAKPSLAERRRVPHWGLDIVSPDMSFTVADFAAYATKTIRDIRRRGNLPLLVGGSGLYIDAVLYGYTFRPLADPQLRRELSRLTVDELQRRITERGLDLPSNHRNPRHLIRTIESEGAMPRHAELRDRTLIIGLAAGREQLAERISRRVETMVAAGFTDEVSRLSATYGWDVQAMQAPGYRAFRGYIEGTKTIDEAKTEFVRSDMRLAKRQRTWFKRNKSIQWLSTPYELSKAVDIATTFLSK